MAKVTVVIDRQGRIRPLVDGEPIEGSFKTEIVGSYREPAEVVIRLRAHKCEFEQEAHDG